MWIWVTISIYVIVSTIKFNSESKMWPYFLKFSCLGHPRFVKPSWPFLLFISRLVLQMLLQVKVKLIFMSLLIDKAYYQTFGFHRATSNDAFTSLDAEPFFWVKLAWQKSCYKNYFTFVGFNWLKGIFGPKILDRTYG